MTRKYFGTDGVRGKVGEAPITPELVLRLGFAAGEVLARGLSGHARPKVLIGKDTRISGYMLEAALEAGFAAAGVDVMLCGPMPTPAVAYLTRALRLSAGIVISASHNPYPDNGIKFFSADGGKLPDAIEQEIEAALEQPLACRPSAELGKAFRVDDAPGRYIEFCKSTFPGALDLRGLRVVVDCAHGAGYHVAPHVFHELGAEVVAIGDEPNGFNINDAVGATHPESLAGSVRAHGADLGIALDGDGDRVLMADESGAAYDGDQLLYVIARRRARAGELAGVVGTLMTNLALERALDALGVGFVRANGRSIRPRVDARAGLGSRRREFRPHHLSRSAHDRRRHHLGASGARGDTRGAQGPRDTRRRPRALSSEIDQRPSRARLRLAARRGHCARPRRR